MEASTLHILVLYTSYMYILTQVPNLLPVATFLSIHSPGTYQNGDFPITYIAGLAWVEGRPAVSRWSNLPIPYIQPSATYGLNT